MADKKISPQGYVYGDDPLSKNPFWSKGEIRPITITPTTAEQIINAEEQEETTGFNPITVNAFPLTNLNITPAKYSLNYTPVANTGYKNITVRAVDSSIDTNIQPENIKEGVSILGVEGTFKGGDTKEKIAIILSNSNTNEILNGQYQAVIGSAGGRHGEQVYINLREDGEVEDTGSLLANNYVEVLMSAGSPYLEIVPYAQSIDGVSIHMQLTHGTWQQIFSEMLSSGTVYLNWQNFTFILSYQQQYYEAFRINYIDGIDLTGGQF